MKQIKKPINKIIMGSLKQQEKINKLRKKYKKYAEENGFRLNPNKEIVDELLKSLLEKEKKYGKKYCPCRKVIKDENVCPCAYHKKEIEEDGHCHCFLFVK